MKTSFFGLLLLALLTGCQSENPSDTMPEPAAASPTGLLSNQSRIVFFGDSITQAGVNEGGYVTLVANSLKDMYPEAGIEVIGAGISGNKVPDLQARVQADVLDKNPTHVVIYIGINDVWHWFKFDPVGTEKEVFESGLRDLVQQFQANDIQVILATPSIIGEKTDGTNEGEEMLNAYSDISRTVAAEEGAVLLDLRKAFTDYLEMNNPDNQESGILTSDGVHLNPAGNQFVADRMLEALLQQ